MSIIAEALKKAQEPSTAKKIAKEEKTPRRMPIRLIYFGAFFALLLIFAGSLTLFHLSRQENVEPEVESHVSSEPVKSIPSAVITPKVKKISATPRRVRKAIRLSGIMYTDRRPLAVINDNIWSEGDQIEEFKISEIGRDFVKVTSDEGEYVVKLKR